MKILDKHFFSLKMDCLAFMSFIPICLLFYFFFETTLFSLPKQPPIWFFILGWTLVDGSHVYSTFLVSYADESMFTKLKTVFLGVPLALLVSGFLFQYSGDPTYFYYFLAYLAMIHFIRQEYGWMKIATHFDSSSPKWLKHLDITTSYAMTILPMLWYTRKTEKAFWYQSGDLVSTPDFLSSISLPLFWFVVMVFLCANAFHIYKTRTINISKCLVFINTFFGWYVSRVFVQNTYLAVWLSIFHHGLPYYFLVFKAERVSRKIKILESIGNYKYPLMYLSCAAVFYLFLHAHSGNHFVQKLEENVVLKSVIYAIAVMPQMTHFILDAFVWKKKYGLQKL